MKKAYTEERMELSKSVYIHNNWKSRLQFQSSVIQSKFNVS